MIKKKGGVLVWDLGLCDYRKAYDHQKALVEKRRVHSSELDTLLFVEHPEVYTHGRKAPTLPFDPKLSVVEIERGGEITYHNPGQLVAYPILALQAGERDLHLHLRRLEGTLIAVLGAFGIAAERRAGATGVWVIGREKKIASIGVAVSGWVTYHGIALNVLNDLAGFQRIHPCGFAPDVMTSMKEEMREATPTMNEVKDQFLHHFLNQFERQLVV